MGVIGRSELTGLFRGLKVPLKAQFKVGNREREIVQPVEDPICMHEVPLSFIGMFGSGAVLHSVLCETPLHM